MFITTIAVVHIDNKISIILIDKITLT